MAASNSTSTQIKSSELVLLYALCGAHFTISDEICSLHPAQCLLWRHAVLCQCIIPVVSNWAVRPSSRLLHRLPHKPGADVLSRMQPGRIYSQRSAQYSVPVCECAGVHSPCKARPHVAESLTLSGRGEVGVVQIHKQTQNDSDWLYIGSKRIPANHSHHVHSLC